MMQFTMRKDNIILQTFYPGDEIDYREDDGKFHSGYRFIGKQNDDEEYVFEKPDGEKFTLMWYHLIRLKNENKIRTAWGTEQPEPPNYEKAVD